MNWVKGSELSVYLRRQVFATFSHRFTGNHRPAWVNAIWKGGMTYPLQFSNDQDWLENTMFAITERGTLARSVDYCISSPTWPENPELRTQIHKAA